VSLTEGQRKVLENLERQVQELSETLKKKGEEIYKKDEEIKELRKQLEEERKAKEEAIKRESELMKQLSDRLGEIEDKNKRINELEDRVRALEEKVKEISEWDAKKIEELRLKSETLKRFESILAEKDMTIKSLEAELEQVKKREEKLKEILEKDPKYRLFLIIRDSGRRNVNELSKSLGLSMVQLKMMISELKAAGLIELDGEEVFATGKYL